jgi:hypothetical protein
LFHQTLLSCQTDRFCKLSAIFWHVFWLSSLLDDSRATKFIDRTLTARAKFVGSDLARFCCTLSTLFYFAEPLRILWVGHLRSVAAEDFSASYSFSEVIILENFHLSFRQFRNRDLETRLSTKDGSESFLRKKFFRVPRCTILPLENFRSLFRNGGAAEP